MFWHRKNFKKIVNKLIKIANLDESGNGWNHRKGGI